MMAAIGDPKSPWLSKFALAKWDSTTAYANVHFPYPFERNPRDAFAALVHLKLFGDFADRVTTAVEEAEHAQSAREYKAYKKWLACVAGKASLWSDEYSTEYRGPQCLRDAGLIEPAPWAVTSGGRRSASE
jgi:hypothetical protein